MKPNFSLTKLTFLFLFFLGTSAIAQTTHVVTLNVNTKKITKKKVNKHANFGQTDGTSNEDYTIYVDVGDTIEWVAVDPKRPDKEIFVDEIQYIRGSDLFNNKRLKRDKQKRQKAKRLIRKVLKGKKGDEEKYTIVFAFMRKGKLEVFKIDPKIVIKK